jgi:adenylyl- and sulfurtransferase ThiI
VAWPPILVRYGEIGIKSRSVRTQFEKRLVDRIEEQLLRRGVEAEIRREQGRFVLRAADVEGALDALRHTFGVVSASPAIETEPTPQAVAAVALGIARERLGRGQSFAMRCKRTGQHAFTSLDVAKATAAAILDELKEREPRVDLTTPDLELQSEVREGGAFVFTRTVRGPGGLPLGSQGRVAVLVDGPRAAHAAWLIGKRGSSLQFLTAEPEKARGWLAPLAPWVGEPRLHALRPGPRAELLAEARPFLERQKCHALVVGDGTQQALASFAEDRLLGFPVFRPLVGYEGERFRAFAREAELPEEA